MKIDIAFQDISQAFPVEMKGSGDTELGAALRDVVQVPSEQDHAKLKNRDAPEQHPIAAIASLTEKMCIRDSLQSTGVDTSKLSEQEIKEANTGDKVFLQASIQILDAIEDINLNITI